MLNSPSHIATRNILEDMPEKHVNAKCGAKLLLFSRSSKYYLKKRRKRVEFLARMLYFIYFCTHKKVNLNIKG